MEDPKRIVQEGYDQLSSRYRTHYEQLSPDRYSEWLTALASLSPLKASILELGCADGIPTARFLSQQFAYLGVDLSPVQVQQARINVPQARFEIADMANLIFPGSSFDAIIALYSLIHLPVTEQPDLIKNIYQWLRPGGYFLCTVGASEWTGTDSNWNQSGAKMYWSHADRATYQSWFTETGFTYLESYFVPEGNGGHTYFLLKKH